MSKKDSKGKAEKSVVSKGRSFGRDEHEARETQRRATAYGRARGLA